MLILVFALVLQFVTFVVTWNTLEFNTEWLNQLDKVDESYQCTYSSLWINVVWLRKETVSGSVSLITIAQVMSIFQIVVTMAEYCAHAGLTKRWHQDNPRDGGRMARAIAVGIPPEVVATLDRETGLSNG